MRKAGKVGCSEKEEREGELELFGLDLELDSQQHLLENGEVLGEVCYGY